jgi:hypothetical protein
MDTELLFQQQQNRVEGEPLNLTKSFDQAATEPGGAEVVQKQELGGGGGIQPQNLPPAGVDQQQLQGGVKILEQSLFPPKGGQQQF